MMGEIKVAFSGTEFSKDEPLDVLLNTAKKFNIEYVELWLPKNVGNLSIEQVKSKLNKVGIKIACVSTWSHLVGVNEVEQNRKLIMDSLEWASKLGTHFVNTYFGHSKTGKEGEDKLITLYVERIKPCLRIAEEKNIIIVLENEFNVLRDDPDRSDVTRKAEGVLKLMKAVDSPFFRVNFDLCNFYIAEEEPYPYTYEILKGYIKYIHLKDGAKYVESRESRYDSSTNKIFSDYEKLYVCTPLGKGAINYDAFLKRLRNEYSGFITLEPHVHREKLIEVLAKSIGYLKEKGLVF